MSRRSLARAGPVEDGGRRAPREERREWAQAELEKMGKLPEPSQKHLRNQLREGSTLLWLFIMPPIFLRMM